MIGENIVGWSKEIIGVIVVKIVDMIGEVGEEIVEVMGGDIGETR